MSEITDGEYQDVTDGCGIPHDSNYRERSGSTGMSQPRHLLELIILPCACCRRASVSGRSLPVILDDIFGMYEEEDLEAVLGWMYKGKKQVIISTCSKREMELLDREGIPYGKQIIS